MKDLEFCPREYALLDVTGKKKKDSFIGTSMRITFDHGRDLEYRVRNDWLRDVAVGNWECEVCLSVHPKFGKAPSTHCSCGYKRWVYKESNFISKVCGVSGSIDIFVDVGEKKLRLVELKSMDKDIHRTLLAPLAEHKFRTNLYLRLIEESGLAEAERINTDVAHILYVSKSFGFADDEAKNAGIPDAGFSPFKEFKIKRDDSLTDTPVNKAKTLLYFKESKKMPAGVCHNGLCKRAQKCPVVTACFSGSYPASTTWTVEGSPLHPNKEVVL
jgi:hypothetical protein